MVDLPAGSNEAFFEMEVENESQSPLAEAWFPKLGGWTGYAGKDYDRLTPGYQGYFDQLNPHSQPLGADWTTFLRGDRRWSVRYPWATFLPWLDVSGGGKGLWLIDYMPEAYLGGFAAENLARGDALSLAFSLDVPFWPQLPRVSFYEDMYVQALEHFPGAVLDEASQRIYIDTRLFYDELDEFFAHEDARSFVLTERYSRVYRKFLAHDLSR